MHSASRKPLKRALPFGVLALTLVVSALPVVIDAQPENKIWRIGYLTGLPRDSPRAVPFLEGLRELGYIEGRNILLEWRYSGGRAERFPDLAAELVRLKVDVIVAGDNPAIAAAQRATRTIPIVMSGAMDPVASGFANSLARPGGNLTGMSAQATDLHAKTLQLLKEAVPTAGRVAILWVPHRARSSTPGARGGACRTHARTEGSADGSSRSRRARQGVYGDGPRQGGRSCRSRQPADLCAPDAHRRSRGTETTAFDGHRAVASRGGWSHVI